MATEQAKRELCNCAVREIMRKAAESAEYLSNETKRPPSSVWEDREIAAAFGDLANAAARYIAVKEKHTGL